MCKAYSRIRLWAAILTLGFACALLAFAVPAFAVENATDNLPSKESLDSGTQNSGISIAEQDDSPALGADENVPEFDSYKSSSEQAAAKEDAAEKDACSQENAHANIMGDTMASTTGEALVAQNVKDVSKKDYEATHTNVYRLYNAGNGDHLYTVDLHEATTLATAGWRWEGVGWVAPLTGEPVYRLYHAGITLHHFTMDKTEYAHLLKVGWRYEGIGWRSDSKDQKPVLRIYDQKSKAGSHMFTTAQEERNALVRIGWKPEGAAWYASNGASVEIKGRWLVTQAWGSLDRYWIASNGEIAKGRFIETDEGSGYTAYAKKNGAVVRGKFNIGNNCVIVANQDGKLACTPDGKDGWIVTSAYDGHLERYFYVAEKRGMRAGFFTINGKQYYGSASDGRIARGKAKWNNFIVLADNDGVMVKGNGWVVTSRFDGDLRRYYLTEISKGSPYTAAKTGLFTVGNARYYGMPAQGYVAHNRYIKADRWYSADNDGKLNSNISGDVGAFMTRAQGFSSRTRYLVLVDTNTCRMGVFTGSKGDWNLIRLESCVCGAPGSPTIRGTYSLGYHLPVLPAWPNALYCTNISGGYFFHSVLGSASELGQHLSHGCVRLNWPTAQYVQSLPTGSTVNLY